jgi:LysR family glycine cleavage system transcriptional activator
MTRLRSRLPPVNSLVVFESASRLMNFTRAAEELGVTQAAVSRQIKVLEDFVGQPLFSRADKRLALTERGERLKTAVTIGLNHIASACDGIVRRRDPSEVTVAASVAFSSYWLMSRVAQFRAQYPDVNLRLIASASSRAQGTDFDLAIRYGHGGWPGMKAEHLFDNDVFPVCAPSYLKRAAKSVLSTEDLLDETLLNLARFDRNWVSWETWFASHGIRQKPLKPGLSFDNYLVLIHAVVAGEGIALCGGRLAQDMLARGEVVRVGTAAMQSDRAFYLVQPVDQPLTRAGLLFRNWLTEQAHASGDGRAGRPDPPPPADRPPRRKPRSI